MDSVNWDGNIVSFNGRVQNWDRNVVVLLLVVVVVASSYSSCTPQTHHPPRPGMRTNMPRRVPEKRIGRRISYTMTMMKTTATIDNNPPVLPSRPLQYGEEGIEAAAVVLALPLW